jgi:YgiT-type zinc finger domain-containing protein
MAQQTMICPVCHVGRMYKRQTAYVNQYGETVVSVPHMPAWVCDVCHERVFDEAALQHVEMLLGQSLLPPNRYRPAPIRKPSNPESPITPARKASAK